MLIVRSDQSNACLKSGSNSANHRRAGPKAMAVAEKPTMVRIW